MGSTLRVFLHEATQENDALDAVPSLALHYGADLSKPDSIMGALTQAKARPAQVKLMRRAIDEASTQARCLHSRSSPTHGCPPMLREVITY